MFTCCFNPRAAVLARRILSISVIVVTSAQQLSAGEWPQILGPNRNGVAIGERLVESLPKGGPAVLWEYKVGDGYAGVAVADGHLIVFHRLGNEEIAEGLDPLSGRRQWEKRFPATYAGGINPDTGPRCVPLIHDGSVYLFGAAGDLYALGLKSGEKRWSRAVGKDFPFAEQSYFGVGSTPIVEGSKLLANVGGKGRAGIVAFNLADGTTVWQATDERASYSSPTAATIDGERQVIFVTRLSAMGINPDNGSIHWQFPFGDRGPTVNAATPQVVDGYLFLSASYGIGAVCRKLGKGSAGPVWANNVTMSSQFSTPVPVGTYLYGTDGRQDGPPAKLRCIDLKTGKIQWTKDSFGVANLIAADGKLVIVTDNGGLVLAAASPEAFRELGRATLSEESATRALPALSNGLLYVRDSATLKCFDLRRGK
jgi:outer membrane protein assembly factor BamB